MLKSDPDWLIYEVSKLFKSECREIETVRIVGRGGVLPTVAAERSSVGRSEATTATTATTSTTTTSAVTTAATATTAVASHLGKTRIDWLLGLGEDSNEITSLFGVYVRLA
jgi:hypothetical protein